VTLVPWATLDDLPADRPTLPGGDDEWTGLLVAASEVLYALTGRRFAGVRTRAVELYAPCSSGGVSCRRCRPARVRLPNRDTVELLAEARLDPQSSSLAGGVTQINRQGVTFTQQAAADLIAAGQTGLPSVDVWLGTINPNRLRRPARSWSPDTDAPYRPIVEEAPAP
jgi:hypothetical protein